MWIPLELSNPVLCEPTKNRMEESNLSLLPPGPNILRQLQDNKISRPITEQQKQRQCYIFSSYKKTPLWIGSSPPNTTLTSLAFCSPHRGGERTILPAQLLALLPTYIRTRSLSLLESGGLLYLCPNSIPCTCSPLYAPMILQLSKTPAFTSTVPYSLPYDTCSLSILDIPLLLFSKDRFPFAFLCLQTP